MHIYMIRVNNHGDVSVSCIFFVWESRVQLNLDGFRIRLRVHVAHDVRTCKID